MDELRQLRERESLVIQTLLFQHAKIPALFLEKAKVLLQAKHMEAVYIERAMSSYRCGYPLCDQPLSASSRGKKRVSLTQKKIYDAEFERQFCSSRCLNVSPTRPSHSPSFFPRSVLVEARCP